MVPFSVTGPEIEGAFRRLGELAADHGKQVELLAVGGAVMVLRFASRPGTRDVDAVILAPEPASQVRDWARLVAEERGWPDDWLNDAAKGFLEGVTSGGVLFSGPGITVRMPASEQMLAMKLGAWRDDRDVSDAVTILGSLSGDRETIWKAVEPFIAKGREQSASYAFETTWELCHGMA